MQTLTELRLKLADLQARVTGFESDIDACVEFIDTLTGGMPTAFAKRAKRTPKTKTNGSAGKAISPEVFRAQVREHWTAQRGRRAKKATRRPTTPAMMNVEQALEAARRKYPNVSDPSPDTMTAQEAARFLRCSDSNVRLLYHAGKLPMPTQELRRFGRSGRYHPAMVIPRAAVEAYKTPGGSTPKPVASKRKKKNGAVRPSEYKNVMKARRERSAKLLARFDRHEPRQVPAEFSKQGISVLVQHGYLKAHGSGYVRTAREFTA